METIIVVDDEAAARRLLYHALKADYRVVEAPDGASALEVMKRDLADLVLLDLHLPPDPDSPAEGIRLHEAIRAVSPLLPVVITTGDADRQLALDMVRRGVADFLIKPIDPAVLRIVVARALERAKLEGELQDLRDQVRERFSFGSLIGRSLAMRRLFAALERLARTSTTVLLLGESGTGKSTIARALHQESSRSKQPFVVVDGATIPESLIESELFGHVRGAYTGADTPKTGRIQMAHGGSLFLDEIGNLSLAAQGKLLLFLDNRSYTPVGSNDEVRVDVRLIAATNRDLERMVGEGRFRQDLLFRLQVATVVLPPLRERREELAPLAELLLALLARPMGRQAARLTPAALGRLEGHSWPGNVRQLKHVLESSLALAEGDTLDADDLLLPPPAQVDAAGAAVRDAREPHPGQGAEAAVDDSAASPVPRVADVEGEGRMSVGGTAGGPDAEGGLVCSFSQQVAAFERRLLLEALEKTSGNKAAAGRRLGLDENQIRYLCRKHGITS